MTLQIGKRNQKGHLIPRASAGFTLIEVILSVVIHSVGLVAVNQTLLHSLSVLSYSQTRFQANRLAENKMWEIQNQTFSKNQPPPRRDEGVLLGTNRTFSYQLQSVSVRGSEFLYEIRMVIHWLESGREKGLSRNFYARLPYSSPVA